MDENVIVTTFSKVSRADEALARLKELAAEEQIDPRDGAIVPRAHDGTLHLRDEAGDDDEADRAFEHISRSIGNDKTTVPADLDVSGPAAVDAAMAAPDGRVTRYARMDVGAEIAGAEEPAHEASVKAREELNHERREATVEKVEAKLRELRERRRHPARR